MNQPIDGPTRIGNLSAAQLGPQPTLLPEDHPDAEARRRLEAGEEPIDIAADLPAASLAWSELAAEAQGEGRYVDAYAYARVGYHRGLDALRQAGWRGAGPVPWSHPENRGFLASLHALGQAAASIGESDEAHRTAEFLDACDPRARQELDGP